MKIDETSINHNALRMIDEYISEPSDYMESKEMMIAVLANIRAVLDMAEEMKKVLSA